jgi:hypothetical protein
VAGRLVQGDGDVALTIGAGEDEDGGFQRAKTPAAARRLAWGTQPRGGG